MVAVLALAAAIYVNFFAHHWLPDARLALFAASAVLFAGTQARYRIWRRERTMPLLPGFVLVALFIWAAENIGTYAQAWRYPHQAAGWAPVSLGKLGSWYLLILVSYALVALAHGARLATRRQAAAPGAAE